MTKGVFQYEYKLVNGPTGDSGTYFFFPNIGRAVLFDMGVLEALSNRELLRVRHVYISHTHIDHFIGFDRLLRVNIPHRNLLTLTGPQGFVGNVEAKLKSYTWNLLEPGQLRFVVRELHKDGKVITARLQNDNNFEPSYDEPSLSGIPDQASVLEEFEDQTVVKGVVLDHRTDSVAYRYEAPVRYHVLVEALERLGFAAGPWIKDLQTAVSSQNMEKRIQVAGGVYKASELSEQVLQRLEPFSVGYLTDFVFSRYNLTRILNAMQGVTILICESCFSEEDRLKAFEKHHLTTRQAALIGALVEARTLQCFHFSSIYGADAAPLLDEVKRSFDLFKSLAIEELKDEINKEMRLMGKMSCSNM